MDFWESPALWVWPPDSCITIASTIRLMQFTFSIFPSSPQHKIKSESYGSIGGFVPLQTDLMLLRILATVPGVFPELIFGRLTLAKSSNESHWEFEGN